MAVGRFPVACGLQKLPEIFRLSFYAKD